ncbi:hypothetical protein ACLI1C_15350 [Devosia sp. XGJD_8]|uniref:hypothetical protein n=1 Tax=Devosia sp. XGJD_8 TaxID=3391187 RepID=UPI003984FFFC
MHYISDVYKLIAFLDRFAWTVSEPIKVDNFHAAYLASTIATLLDSDGEPESEETWRLIRNAALDTLSERFSPAPISMAHLRFLEELMPIEMSESVVSHSQAILMLIDAVGRDHWLVTRTRKGKLRIQMTPELAKLLDVDVDVKIAETAGSIFDLQI